MKKHFVCLANSKKFNQRCIAGIELSKAIQTESTFNIVKRNDKVVWIRPVSQSEHGEVDSGLVEHISLLDIVEINVTASVPNGYQCENVLFDNRPLGIVGRIEKSESLLDKLSSETALTLFGNKSKSVDARVIDKVDHSLVFIKPKNVKIRSTQNFRGDAQVRALFSYRNIYYDLPVTDIDFEKEFLRNESIVSASNRFYFTVSLGVEFNGQHYKLIAGIIQF